MLSAVAARKAALAAKGQVDEPAVASGSQTPSPAAPKNGTSKRKSAAQKSRSEAKKPRKVNGAQKPKSKAKEDTRARDEFTDQTDMIVMEVSDDEDSDPALSMYDEDPAQELSARRAWSPSQPVEDSSDEDSPGREPQDISSLFPGSSNSQTRVDDDTGPLSTFEPLVDENVFFLTESELSLLGLSEPTTLVVLNSDDSLCLLGTCKLAVLLGSLTVSGTVLTSSRTIHAIFAPRSSPLPILTATGGSPSSSVLPASNLSPRLQRLLECKTVIAIQESRSGVEGLGRICRTFEGVFEPSRWQRSSMTAPFEIPGIFMVRALYWKHITKLDDVRRSQNKQKSRMLSSCLHHGRPP